MPNWLILTHWQRVSQSKYSVLPTQNASQLSLTGIFLCPENPQLGWGFSKAFSFGSVIKTPFDLLKQFAVWQLQMFNKKSKGGPNEG
ncbi:hypothetical protein BFI45_05820 [Yersinia pestis subsp. microtus bv. Altaica]|nr:hypothetical protein CH59_1280 [Yersinia pestis]AJI97987.1 hypothetical protein BZ18_1624 [Yersinia pestis Pestoides F]AJJ77210.1 hypothetical protein CH57_2819 [Yersinia pestis A1122]AJJ80955.1 hypothetical protein CH58_1810 [Yersinia pestis Antiqua]AJJ85665.1 hypothetical protein CH56_1999 [Yersinia pestis Angola]AJJ90276.1 hypothetical protein AK38_1986 [Yersinia pestis CO92]AJK13163.1 hypothetical protein CH60_2927 [Yersinia pestis str. Pestoides B]AJK23664.1 hypothetical protein CH43